MIFWGVWGGAYISGSQTALGSTIAAIVVLIKVTMPQPSEEERFNDMSDREAEIFRLQVPGYALHCLVVLSCCILFSLCC
jgi:hypothetical protein